MANGTSGTRRNDAKPSPSEQQLPQVNTAASPLKQGLAKKYSAYDTSAEYSNRNNISDELLDQLLDDGYGTASARTQLENMNFSSGRVELLDLNTGEKVTLKKETVSKSSKDGYTDLGNKYTIVSGAMAGLSGEGFEVFSEKDWPKAVFRDSVFSKKIK